MRKLANTAGMLLAVGVAACGGTGPDAHPAAASHLTPADKPIVAAVEDLWMGVETHDARRFCRSIVGKVGKRFIRIGRAACTADFRNRAFDDFLDGWRLQRITRVARHGRVAKVEVRIQKAGRHQTDKETLVFAFGRWRLPLGPSQ